MLSVHYTCISAAHRRCPAVLCILCGPSSLVPCCGVISVGPEELMKSGACVCMITVGRGTKGRATRTIDVSLQHASPCFYCVSNVLYHCILCDVFKCIWRHKIKSVLDAIQMHIDTTKQYIACENIYLCMSLHDLAVI